jgi:hypothetical protein
LVDKAVLALILKSLKEKFIFETEDMSIKDIVDFIKFQLSELKDLIPVIKSKIRDLASWLYNREWSLTDIAFIILALAIAYGIAWIDGKLQNKIGKKINTKSNKRAQDSQAEQGINRLRRIKEKKEQSPEIK